MMPEDQNRGQAGGAQPCEMSCTGHHQQPSSSAASDVASCALCCARVAGEFLRGLRFTLLQLLERTRGIPAAEEAVKDAVSYAQLIGPCLADAAEVLGVAAGSGDPRPTGRPAEAGTTSEQPSSGQA
jgi:hypothetical protein